jgi:hypothetical protein
MALFEGFGERHGQMTPGIEPTGMGFREMGNTQHKACLSKLTDAEVHIKWWA